MKLFCGIDWAEGHHDLAVIDADGQLVVKKRITDDPAGFTELIEGAITIGAAETVAIGTLPRSGTSSTSCSASSTIASKSATPSTKRRHSPLRSVPPRRSGPPATAARQESTSTRNVRRSPYFRNPSR